MARDKHSTLKLQAFFGFDLKQGRFIIDHYINKLNLKTQINKHPTVVAYRKRHGANNMIVTVAKRQMLLKYMQPLLRGPLLEYDQYWYVKEVNTASKQDRRYEAEEKLMSIGLIVAAGRTMPSLENSGYTPNVIAIRKTPDSKRFERLWGVLGENTKEFIGNFKKKNEDLPPIEEKKSLISKLFG